MFIQHCALLASTLIVIIAKPVICAAIPPNNSLHKRIYGGFVVPPSMVPHVVSLGSSDGIGITNCGGSLISPNHVVTAAHCVISRTSQEVFPPQNITIGYNSADKDTQDFVQASKVTLHPKAYINKTLDMDYELAVLEFPGFLQSPGAKRIPVYQQVMDAGQTMLSLGWGVTESTSIDRSELRGVLTTIGGAEQCNEQADSDLTEGGSVICALGSENIGKCIMSGDSGTGAVINQSGVLMLAGINSQVTVYNGTLDCSGGELTAFYLRPAYFLDFIASSTGLTQEYLTGVTDKL